MNTYGFSPMRSSHSHATTLQSLRQQIRGLSPHETRQSAETAQPTSQICRLPAGGLVELLSHRPGGGASTLAFQMARGFQMSRHPFVIIDSQKEFCPPGWAQLGLDLSQSIVVRTARRRDVLWVLEQSLRSTTGAIAICRLEHLSSTVYRRLKLAAERGRGRGVLLRDARYRSEPSWADVRLLVQPVPMPNSPALIQSRRLRVEVLHVKGSGFDRRVMVVDISDETGCMSVVSQLALPTTMAETA